MSAATRAFRLNASRMLTIVEAASLGNSLSRPDEYAKRLLVQLAGVHHPVVREMLDDLAHEAKLVQIVSQGMNR
jgi:hypothetical protein